MDMDTNRCKLSIVSLFMISCALVLLTSSIAISGKESRIALVIGNGAYKSSPLSNPVNDANDMAAALERLGFSVRLKINANQKSMENAIRDFGKELRSGGDWRMPTREELETLYKKGAGSQWPKTILRK